MVARARRPLDPRAERVDRIELEQVHTRAAEALEESIRRTARRETIVGQVDRDVLRALADKEIGELASDGIVGEDVRLDVDMVPRTADGFANGPLDRMPVRQQRHAVAEHEWRGRDRRGNAQLLRQHPRRGPRGQQLAQHRMLSVLDTAPLASITVGILPLVDAAATSAATSGKRPHAPRASATSARPANAPLRSIR